MRATLFFLRSLISLDEGAVTRLARASHALMGGTKRCEIEKSMPSCWNSGSVRLEAGPEDIW